ncbi:uncharacterized protein BYT42DRAFT_368680 [Radiomyces spectabilis]|uniref:uncharacterized protein n=1 Tax=Radiomyces spectabilis TaxID=64574 RepID=UPI002220EA75|nr:uncharacterized protein BYT42DRAFT_368680 [Radiomyces spectabilis]KAI8375947.1 hypothetical protein BYT42DRAFT_368680 [Radiomyces spectabilis]
MGLDIPFPIFIFGVSADVLSKPTPVFLVNRCFHHKQYVANFTSPQNLGKHLTSIIQAIFKTRIALKSGLAPSWFLLDASSLEWFTTQQTLIDKKCFDLSDALYKMQLSLEDHLYVLLALASMLLLSPPSYPRGIEAFHQP